MSALYDRLKASFDEGHRIELQGLCDEREYAPRETRPAAVLIAVTDRPDPGVIFLHRPDRMRAHPGQVAFPGGNIDPGEDVVTAALREAHEELAIDASGVRVVGASDPFVSLSGYSITPVLAVVAPDLLFSPNTSEVASWFEAPLSFLLDPANHRYTEVEEQGRMQPIVEIEWEGHLIWGISAGLLANLSRRLSWNTR